MSEPVGGSPIALVISWFGRDLRGGAEQLAWNLAKRLAARGLPIEVLTTCCRSFQDDWAVNHHPAGLHREPEGFGVRRFPVEPRDRDAFDRVCGHLLALDHQVLKPGVSPLSEQDERIFSDHLIRCPALAAYLRSDGWRYSAFIFLPYLYGPILQGLPLVASRAFLQPCLHDESYAYLRAVQKVFFSAKGLLWNSDGEKELGLRLYGPAITGKSFVVGTGMEPIQARDGNAQASEVASLKPFVLLLGRKDRGKGTFLAVDAFRNYRAQRGTRFKLVIAGPGEPSLTDPTNGVHDLGLVSEPLRDHLLRNAEALLQPSPNESFSRVVFEAWQCERPVIVRRSCLATSQAVKACGGGWLAESNEEWVEALATLELASERHRRSIGFRGAVHAAAVADWDRVVDHYEQILRPFLLRSTHTASIRLSLSANQSQRVRLLVDGRETAAWDLGRDLVCRSGWLDLDYPDSGSTLRLETDRPATYFPPDLRPLGFRLEDLETAPDGVAGPHLQFGRGWNRSEGGPGTPGPRWSTGSAEITVRHLGAAGRRLAIHQVLPNLNHGDAIGNHSIWIRDCLQSMGYESEIYAHSIAPDMLDQAYPLSDPQALPRDAPLIYHHSIGTEITPWMCRHPGPKALLFHNITPAHYFDPYRPEFAAICRRGREQLPRLAPYFPVSAGVSDFNARELAATGFRQPRVLPLCVDPSRWAFPPDESVMAQYQDGRTNILFVGRIAPNKRHEDLIYTFKFWLEEDPQARLFIAGTTEGASLYLECLQTLARKLRVDHAVHFLGKITDAQLHACYRCASMFWCFSEHEGFCIPLLEACVFRVPVVAVAAGAVPETLGRAGLLLPQKRNARDTARQIAAALPGCDPACMAERAAHFGPEAVRQKLQVFVETIHSTYSDLPGEHG